jgi:hypothetical protein
VIARLVARMAPVRTQGRYRSALPYTVITGRADNGDLANNDRPPQVARNSERGSAAWTVDASTMASTLAPATRAALANALAVLALHPLLAGDLTFAGGIVRGVANLDLAVAPVVADQEAGR